MWFRVGFEFGPGLGRWLGVAGTVCGQVLFMWFVIVRRAVDPAMMHEA